MQGQYIQSQARLLQKDALHQRSARRAECSARGVLNEHEDSSDDEAYCGEQKEVVKEMQELRAAQQWVNRPDMDVEAEGKAMSENTGQVIDLRLDWAQVKQKLEKGHAPDVDLAPKRVGEEVVLRDYSLDDLDPTQRAFANRTLKWATEVVRVYKDISATGPGRPVPQLRSWLGGSAGSCKSTTLKTCVQHMRLLFQREKGDASVELAACTGVAAFTFNIGFGAKTACSSFQVFPQAAWQSELAGDAFKKLEQQWRRVMLLIVDEVPFVGKTLFARMHFRLQQAKR